MASRVWSAAGLLLLAVCVVSHDVVPVILVHGGAGSVAESRWPDKLRGVQAAVRAGAAVLATGGSALDAVEAAVASMEDDVEFNAGYGSVLNIEGVVEMEASMQRGSDLSSGAVTLVRDFPNPIHLARRVLDETPHSMIGGAGLRQFALQQGFTPVDPVSLISSTAQQSLQNYLDSIAADSGYAHSDYLELGEGGTVGAVALDAHGGLAAATTTGGLTGKLPGRIGDSPLIGAGTYADDTAGAVSCTGHGESILKVSLAHEIVRSMAEGASAQAASARAVDRMVARLNNTAGVVTLSPHGDVGIYYATQQMSWAYARAGELHYGITHGDDFVEPLDLQ